MSIYCLSADHRTATLAVRERIVPTAAQQAKLYQYFSEPLVIVATCNRTEFYFSSLRQPAEILLELVQLLPGLELDLGAFAWLASAGDTTLHLLRVASGLESQILGEGQVLGQIRRSYERARLLARADTALHTIFQSALATGKRVRNETGISRGNVSLAAVAVETAGHLLPLAQQSVAVVGTGETGQLIAKFLYKQQVEPHIFGKFGEPFERFIAKLDQFDIVFAATAPRRVVLTVDDLENREKPLAIFDLGLPRHVAAGVRSLPLVRLWDLDDLTDSISANLAARQVAATEAEQIVSSELARLIPKLERANSRQPS